MNVLLSADFADHEQVVFVSDPSGLKAIIAVHSTTRGPAIGGCRFRPYADERAAVSDVLRLSRGMTLKAAVADVPFGGGKMVVLADPDTDKSPELLRAVGRAIDRLGGRYITGEDVGTTVADMAEIKSVTDYVMGMPEHLGGSGDPSPRTALGCFVGIGSSVRHRFGTDSLQGVRVAVQGLGNVGWNLSQLLVEAGAELVVADVRPHLAERAGRELGALVVAPHEIHLAKADVFAPCALGAVLDDTTIPDLGAAVVAGGANNQLLDETRHGAMLRERKILYAPDYVINGGGMIQLALERTGLDWDEVDRKVRAIGDTLAEIYGRADAEGVATAAAARELAMERLG